MNAQLVHGPSDRHLWAQSYTRDLRDVLDLQREIAGAIAREIDVAAAPLATPRARSAGRPDSAPRELYLRELYLRGRHAENSRSLAGIQTAKEAYRRAVEQDSTFARAYAGVLRQKLRQRRGGAAPNLIGIDHLRLTTRFQGREFRLTDIGGSVVKSILA